MRIALFTGGQPRFTDSFLNLMRQLEGFDTADVYMSLWKSEWAVNEDDARTKIEKTLLPKYNLKKINLIGEPDWESKLPPHNLKLAPPVPETITWWFKRIYLQFFSLQNAFDLIDDSYDMYIRFRLDGELNKILDLRKYSPIQDLILPKNCNCGFKDFLINDQFALGNRESMHFYCKFSEEFPKLIPLSDSNWLNNGKDRSDNWSWSTEHVMGTYMKLHNKQRNLGDFEYYINVKGRSKFTDKHYHHPIVKDPTL